MAKKNLIKARYTLTREENHILKDLLNKECGLTNIESKSIEIESLVTSILSESEYNTLKDFLFFCKFETKKEFVFQLIDIFELSDSQWISDNKSWFLFRDHILPNLIDDLKKRRKQEILIWSAGDSNGQEAYSIAMMIDDMIRADHTVTRNRFIVLGTDKSPNQLFKATAGRFNKKVMSTGLPPEFMKRYFKESYDVFEVIPEIKSMVQFRELDIHGDFTNLPIFDVIFCRHITSKFSTEVKKKLYKNLFKGLNPDGYLILGLNEEILDDEQIYVQNDYYNVKYYRPSENSIVKI